MVLFAFLFHFYLCTAASGGVRLQSRGLSLGKPERGLSASVRLTALRSSLGTVKVWDPRQKETPVANMEPAQGESKRDCWTVAFGNGSDDSPLPWGCVLVAVKLLKAGLVVQRYHICVLPMCFKGSSSRSVVVGSGIVFLPPLVNRFTDKLYSWAFLLP